MKRIRILSLLMALALVFAMLPATVFAAETVDSGTCGANGDNLTWVLDSDGTLTISGTGKMMDYTTKNQTLANTPWYLNRAAIKKVVVKSGVTTIGSYAFFDCYNLTSVVLPGTVTSMSDGAFMQCKKLESIDIPNTDTFQFFGQQCFYGCSSLKSIQIPKGAELIGKQMFAECTSLTSVGIPDGLVTIENAAFRGCTSLTKIDLPGKFRNLGDYAFANCASLTSVTIPEGVTKIGKECFRGCSSLISVKIPGTVTSIEERAFSDCTSLKSVAIPNGVQVISDYTFFSCSSLTSVTIPGSVVKIGYQAFASCTSLAGITIPDSVTEIGDYAFSGCASLAQLPVPARVSVIGLGTFKDCTSLTRVAIPKGVSNIKVDAFRGCTNLTSILFPAGVTWIDSFAFYGCNNISQIVFLGDAPHIGGGAFGDITATGYYPADNATWTEEIRSNCGRNITWVVLGANGNPFTDVQEGKYYYEPVLWAANRGITNGINEVWFGPYDTCTRAQVVTFLWRAAGCPEPASTAIPFPDVPADKYYTKAVLWAAENGITNGRPDGTFCPYDTVTRAEFVTFLWRAQGKPAATGEAAFRDVPADKYYTEAIAWAAEKGITTGVAEGVFGTYEPCTRAHVVTFLYRACGE